MSRLPRAKGFKPWRKGRPLVVVVDMQESYAAARDADLVRRVNAGVRRRLAARCDVLLLAYHEQGSLTIEHPPGVPMIWKDDDDGSHSILSYLAGAGAWPQRVELWGVNTVCCVIKTCIGVAIKFEAAGYGAVPVEVNLRYCGDASKAAAVRFTRAA